MRKSLIMGAAFAMAGCAALKEQAEIRLGNEIQGAKETLKTASDIAKKKAREAKEEIENELSKKD